MRRENRWEGRYGKPIQNPTTMLNFLSKLREQLPKHLPSDGVQSAQQCLVYAS